MNKMSFVPGFRVLASAILLLSVGSLWASADDRFSVAIGSHDLLVFDSKDGRKAELPLPSISQAVTVDGTTFQVSYGRDANDLLTAIFAPNPSQAQDLHYTVLGKSIDSDKAAVVTLTFSKNLKSVRIDPGYVGVVEVNAHRLNHDSAQSFPLRRSTPDRTPTPTVAAQSAPSADQSSSTTVASVFAPAATPASSTTTTSTATAATTPAPTSTPPEKLPVAANQPSTTSSPADETENHVSDHAPEPMQTLNATQAPFTASATPGPSTVSAQGTPDAPKQHSLYWAEPITPASGPAPAVGANEMKLVELKGSVSVKAPGGSTADAQEGMIVPSGSTISTSGGSSAALFMGGINSIRLLPDSEIQVTQDVSSSSRKTIITLNDGTIFNRVGHRDGEIQNYQVVTPEGVAVAKGTEFADSLANGHHYVFVVKGIVAMLINDVLSGTLTALPGNLASGAMPPATDGNKVLFAALTALQPFQSKLQAILEHIKAGTATPAELTYFDNLKKTFTVAVDDVYDPTHPNAFLGAFTSTTGFGDSTHSTIERPQDFANPNPQNNFDLGLATVQPFFTPAVDPGTGPAPTGGAPITN